MKHRSRGFTNRSLRLALAVGGSAAIGATGIALSGTPAAAASLTGVSFSVSNNATSSAGATNTAQYSWNFNTATAGTLTSLTFTVPAADTLASPTTTQFGLTGCTLGTPSLSSGTVTITLTGCPSIPAGRAVQVVVTGLTNTTNVTQGSFTSTVATFTGSSVLNDQGTASTTFGNNTTAVTVVVPQSLTFLNGTTAITLLPVPGTVATANSTVPLTVSTNARNGYKLSACVGSTQATGQITGGTSGATIAQASNTTAGPLTGSAFGAQAVVSGGAALQAPWSTATGSNYLGYNASCGTGSGQVISADAGPTSGDTTTITNAVSVSATEQADTYSGTISYQVSPSY